MGTLGFPCNTTDYLPPISVVYSPPSTNPALMPSNDSVFPLLNSYPCTGHYITGQQSVFLLYLSIVHWHTLKGMKIIRVLHQKRDCVDTNGLLMDYRVHLIHQYKVSNPTHIRCVYAKKSLKSKHNDKRCIVFHVAIMCWDRKGIWMILCDKNDFLERIQDKIGAWSRPMQPRTRVQLTERERGAEKKSAGADFLKLCEGYLASARKVCKSSRSHAKKKKKNAPADLRGPANPLANYSRNRKHFRADFYPKRNENFGHLTEGWVPTFPVFFPGSAADVKQNVSWNGLKNANESAKIGSTENSFAFLNQFLWDTSLSQGEWKKLEHWAHDFLSVSICSHWKRFLVFFVVVFLLCNFFSVIFFP